MLGHTERESATHALSAARLAGWADNDVAPLNLGSMNQTLATVAHLRDIAAVVHMGHPAQPSHDLELALLAGSPVLTLTSAVTVPSQWVWAGPSLDAHGSVVVDEAGLRDLSGALHTMGAEVRLVPSRASLTERMAAAGPSGSLVIERDLLPAGWVELPGSAQLGRAPATWFGLVESTSTLPVVTGSHQVWLAFGPTTDHRGSLQRALGYFADVGVDLQHLRSHRSQSGLHVFFSAFSCESAATLAEVLAVLRAQSIAHRVLAVFAGHYRDDGPHAITPQWHSASQAG